MKGTKLLVATGIVAVVLGGASLLKSTECKNTQVELSGQKNGFLNEQMVQRNEKLVEIVNIDCTNDGDSNISLKNTSGNNFKRVNVKIGNYKYELFDLKSGETYVIHAYEVGKEAKVEVISTEYQIDSLNEDETELKMSEEKNKNIVKITNKGDRELYPNRVVYFVKDNNGNVYQKSLEYSGCFEDEFVIKKGKTFEVELEVEEGFELVQSKGVIFKYSDTKFKEYDVKFFEEM